MGSDIGSDGKFVFGNIVYCTKTINDNVNSKVKAKTKKIIMEDIRKFEKYVKRRSNPYWGYHKPGDRRSRNIPINISTLGILPADIKEHHDVRLDKIDETIIGKSPIVVMIYEKKLVIVDGLHRIVKGITLGVKRIPVAYITFLEISHCSIGTL